ncbi:phospholipase D-like domain-containing protein [Delftia sp. HK171]|uniref:phospholipase D-like domain-containing protein n=1 Tax=Delftia sp. HK171 TaxID=1920191 RepID=UPI0009037A85|nr:phospholipase D-like domain-containing protein [Delftia sp. HK171]
MSRLLYHAPDTQDQESPFDRAIVQVIRDQDVKIVSPYISLEYLQRIIHMARSWRLVSDVLEWLSATPRRERDLVYDFLAKHDGLIHHYPAIHAKTVLSGVAAYTGSANLTHAGVLRRTEFGVLLTDLLQVQEIHDWFDAIWLQTSPPPLHSVVKLIAELNSITNQSILNTSTRPAQIDSTARRVRARLVNVLGHKPISIKLRREMQDTKTTRAFPPLAAELLIPAKPNKSTEPIQYDKTPVVHNIVLVPSHAIAPSIPAPALNIRVHSDAPQLAPAWPHMAAPPAFDIESEIKFFVDRNADTGFTFIQAHTAMRSLARGLRMRETYLALLEWCASHPRSIFSEDAVHRLVYINGRFIQSKEAELQRALEPMDRLVSRILDTLSFNGPTQWSSDQVRQSTPPAVFKKVVSGMVHAGFVHTTGGLRLIPTANWSQRLKLLKLAYRSWSARIGAYEVDLARQRALGKQSAPGSTGQKYSKRDTLVVEAVTINQIPDGQETPSDTKVERLAQFDKVFAHLAWLYVTKGEIIESKMDSLVIDLMDVSKLRPSEIKLLISGTYTLLRSPFAVMQTSCKNKLRIYHDLLDNTHLHEYPNTRQIIEKSTTLRDLTISPKPLHLPLLDETDKLQLTAKRVKRITHSQADDAYALICEYIYEHFDLQQLPMSRRSILRLLSNTGIDPDVINKLLFASRETRLNLFTLIHYGTDSIFLRLNHIKLAAFPTTKHYLETQVWAKKSFHYWLPSQTSETNALKNHGISTLVKLKNKASERDKIYALILRKVVNSIPSNSRFKTYSDLINALNVNTAHHFTIGYLLGIMQAPKSPLLTFRKDEVGCYLKLEPDALPLYQKCYKFIKQMFDGEIKSHPWLLNQSNSPWISSLFGISIKSEQSTSTAQPIQIKGKSLSLNKLTFDKNILSTAASTSTAISRETLPPMVWKDKTYLKLDTIFTDIAQLFSTYGNPIKNSVTDDNGELVQLMALKKYELANNVRNNAQEVIQPVLSLRIQHISNTEIELVIYKSYREYKDNFPKLQRLLYVTKLKLREV